MIYALNCISAIALKQISDSDLPFSGINNERHGINLSMAINLRNARKFNPLLNSSRMQKLVKSINLPQSSSNRITTEKKNASKEVRSKSKSERYVHASIGRSR